ncbi:MAG: hypothetical protein V4625_03510 [Pseudomonadota bacterium]
MAKHDSTPEYTGLRQTLVRLQAAPVPDQSAIDRVIDELEQVQLRIKNEQTGVRGNNPNE